MRKPTHLVVALTLLVGSPVFPGPSAKAAERKGMSRKDLVGIWEAIQANPMRLFVAEIHESPAESYLAMVSEDVVLFRIQTLTVRGSRIELQSEGTGPSSHLRLSFTGAGWAGGGEGNIPGTFSLFDSEGKHLRQKWHLDLLNCRGNLIEELLQMKNKAGDTIAAEKRRTRPSEPKGDTPVR